MFSLDPTNYCQEFARYTIRLLGDVLQVGGVLAQARIVILNFKLLASRGPAPP